MAHTQFTTEGFKHFIVHSSGRVSIVDITNVDDNTWELNRICVDQFQRGRGYGTELLKSLTANADRLGMKIVLWINPYGPLSHGDLFRWYLRHGFIPQEEYAAWEMIRHPKGTTDGAQPDADHSGG